MPFPEKEPSAPSVRSVCKQWLNTWHRFSARRRTSEGFIVCCGVCLQKLGLVEWRDPFVLCAERVGFETAAGGGSYDEVIIRKPSWNCVGGFLQSLIEGSGKLLRVKGQFRNGAQQPLRNRCVFLLKSRVVFRANPTAIPWQAILKRSIGLGGQGGHRQCGAEARGQ